MFRECFQFFGCNFGMIRLLCTFEQGHRSRRERRPFGSDNEGGRNRSCTLGFSSAIHFNTSALLKIFEIRQNVAALKVQIFVGCLNLKH